MADKQKTDIRSEKKQLENPKKTPEKKNLVQLHLQKVPDSIRNADSSDIDSPLGALPGVSGFFIDLKYINDSLSDMRKKG